MHHGSVVGDRIDDLIFVGPPVAEARTARTQFGNFIGHLVALENVLKRRDRDFFPLRQPDKHQHFVLPVRVNVDHPFALQHFHRSLEPQIATRRQRRLAGLPICPFAFVVTRLRKRIRHHLLHTHTGLRVTRRTGEGCLKIRALHVLTERKLHSGFRPRELQILGHSAPPQLNHLILSAHRIGRSVQHIRRREAARQLPVNTDVRRVDHIADSHLYGHGARAFVHSPRDRRVRMTIDEPGGHVFARRIDHGRSRWRDEALAHFFNFSRPHEHVATHDPPLRPTRPQRRVLDQDPCGLHRQSFQSVGSGRIRIGRRRELLGGLRLVRLFIRGFLVVGFWRRRTCDHHPRRTPPHRRPVRQQARPRQRAIIESTRQPHRSLRLLALKHLRRCQHGHLVSHLGERDIFITKPRARSPATAGRRTDATLNFQLTRRARRSAGPRQGPRASHVHLARSL